MNQPEVPEKYREIEVGEPVWHVSTKTGHLIHYGLVTKAPFFNPNGVDAYFNLDGWMYGIDGVDNYYCRAAQMKRPVTSAESRLAEIAGLVREKTKMLEKVSEAYKTLPFGPFGHWASEVNPTDCLLLGGHGEDASAIAHQIDRDDAIALADILNAAEEMKELLERIEQLTKEKQSV